MRVLLLVMLLATTPALAAAPSATNPVGWRYDGTGVFADAKPPIKWAPDGANMRWKMKFDDPYAWGNAQPIVVGKRVFVFNEPTWMACLDADTGAILWRKDLNLLWMEKGDEFARDWALWEERTREARAWIEGGRKDRPRLRELDALLLPKVQYMGDGCQAKGLKGYGFSTPVSDGALVYVKNATGVLAAVDLDGGVKWMRNIGHDAGDGSVASPCLVDGHLIVWRKTKGGYVLSSFDPASGDPQWETAPRPPGTGSTCPSPVVFRLKGVPVVLTACGDVVRASDGKIMASKVHAQTFCTPPVHDDTVYFGLDGTIEAVRLTLNDDETVSAKSLWKVKPTLNGKNSNMYGGHVYYEGYVYMLQDLGQFYVIDAATGEVKQAIQGLAGTAVYGNLAAADGRIYGIAQKDGQMLVVKAGPEGTILARNPALGKGTSSPCFDGNRIYVRTSEWVYCLEEAPKSDGKAP